MFVDAPVCMLGAIACIENPMTALRTHVRTYDAPVGTSLICALFLLLTACSGPREDAEPDSAGAIFAGADGAWIVLNYWAEWCAPCREEIPELNALDAEFAPALQVFGVNFDGIQGDELAALSQRMGIAFDVLALDPLPQLAEAPIGVLPTTLIINPDRIVVARLVGPQDKAGLVERWRLLSAAPSP